MNKQAQTLETEVSPDEILQLKVSRSWIRFIIFCRTEAPHSELRFKVVNGEPTNLLECKKNIRFDKEDSIPINFGNMGNGEI